jgi:hypothetical protein
VKHTINVGTLARTIARCIDGRWLLAALAGVFLGVPGVTAGEPDAAQGTERRGFVAGLAAGFTTTSLNLCGLDDCSDGFAVSELKLGGMISRKAALILDFANAAQRSGPALWNHHVLAAAVQYWPARRVWLKGGVGLGFVDRGSSLGFLGSGVGSVSTTHAAGLVGAGVEMARHGRFALDCQLPVFGTRGTFPANDLFHDAAPYKGVVKSVTAAVGVNWY